MIKKSFKFPLGHSTETKQTVVHLKWILCLRPYHMCNEINMILKLNTTDSPLLNKISIPILQTTTPCRELTVNSSNDLLVGEIGPSKTIHCKYCTCQRFGAMAIRQNSGCLQKCRTSRMFAKSWDLIFENFCRQKEFCEN